MSAGNRSAFLLRLGRPLVWQGHWQDVLLQQFPAQQRGRVHIAGLRKAVDQFFDGVMVMAENEAVRNNRLALLAELLREFTTVADFSEIGGEERR